MAGCKLKNETLKKSENMHSRRVHKRTLFNREPWYTASSLKTALESALNAVCRIKRERMLNL